jgi:hypothetical protein
MTTVAKRARAGSRASAPRELAIGMLFLMLALRAALVPSQDDTFWHLRAGEEIWRNHRVPHVDTYSFTSGGWPWRDHEWLWQPVSYASTAGRDAGDDAVRWRAGVATMVVAYRLMVGRASDEVPADRGGVAAAAAQRVGAAAAAGEPAGRPAAADVLVRDRFWPIPLLFVVWANVHGAVGAGRRRPDDGDGGRALALARPAHTRGRPPRAGRWRSCCRSRGWLAWRRPGHGHPALPHRIDGAHPRRAHRGVADVVRDRTAHGPVLDGRARPGGAGVPAPPRAARRARVVVDLVGDRRERVRAAGADRGAIRNIGAFSLSPSRRPATCWARTACARRPAPPAPDPARASINLVILVGDGDRGAAMVARSYRTGDAELGWHPIDDRALAAVRACDGPLYNHYDEGGYLLWFVPEKPVFVDGRQDPFPLEHVLASLDVERERAPYRPLFDRWGIRCVFPVRRIAHGGEAGSRRLDHALSRRQMGRALRPAGRYFPPLSEAITPSSSLAWTPGSTSGKTRATLPSGPIRNDTRAAMPSPERRHAVGLLHGARRIGHQREGQRVLLHERQVARRRIARDTKNGDARRDELVERVAERARLARAAGGVVLRIEVDDRVVPLLRRQLERRPLGVGPDDLGRRRPDRQQRLVRASRMEERREEAHRRQRNRGKTEPHR